AGPRHRLCRGDPRRQHALPRRRGRAVRHQVGDRLRRGRAPPGARQAAQGARPGPARLRPRAGDRRGHGLLRAPPAHGGRRAARDLHRHLPRDARGAAGERGAAGPRGGDRRRRRRAPAAAGRDLRRRPGPRRPAPPARPRPGLPGDAPGAAAGRDGLLRRRAEPGRRPHRHGSQAGRGLGRAGLAGAHQRPPGAGGPQRRRAGQPPARGPRRRPRVRPRRPAARRRPGGPRGRAGPRRGAPGQLVRLGQPRAGGHRRPGRRAVAVAPVRLPGLPPAAGGRPPPARVPAAAGDLLQPHAVGSEAGL
ncbi:MAG: hypothetical protein(), partial [uncultured Solirubrobacteraceae bacterium]